MKKELQQELIALAKTIIETAESRDVPVNQLKKQAQKIYEKLTVMEFTQQGLQRLKGGEDDTQPSLTATEKEGPIATAPTEPVEVPASHPEDSSEHYTPDGTEYREQEAITEPNTEKIKDIVAQMPPESDQIDQMLNSIFPKIEPEENPWKRQEQAGSKKPQKKQDKETEQDFGVHYDRLPLFEPVESQPRNPDKPKSVNDRLKSGIHIGLNDRHAFVKHLFGGSTSDYNRVLSQLNTHKSREEALSFIENMVKPDYNNWEGKELYETRFLNIIDNRFD